MPRTGYRYTSNRRFHHLLSFLPTKSRAQSQPQQTTRLRPGTPFIQQTLAPSTHGFNVLSGERSTHHFPKPRSATYQNLVPTSYQERVSFCHHQDSIQLTALPVYIKQNNNDVLSYTTYFHFDNSTNPRFALDILFNSPRTIPTIF